MFFLFFSIQQPTFMCTWYINRIKVFFILFHFFYDAEKKIFRRKTLRLSYTYIWIYLINFSTPDDRPFSICTYDDKHVTRMNQIQRKNREQKKKKQKKFSGKNQQPPTTDRKRNVMWHWMIKLWMWIHVWWCGSNYCERCMCVFHNTAYYVDTKQQKKKSYKQFFYFPLCV